MAEKDNIEINSTEEVKSEEVVKDETTKTEDTAKTESKEEVKKPEPQKTFTQDELNKILKKEKEKLVNKNKTDTEKLQDLEKWKEQQELKEELREEEKISQREQAISNLISSKVRENKRDRVLTILKNDINDKTPMEEVEKTLTSIIKEFPGVELGSTIDSSILQTASVTEAQNVEEEEKVKTPNITYSVYKLKNVIISEEEYNNLPPAMKDVHLDKKNI